MIPKILHYCWFGGGEYNELMRHCMSSWQTYLPDYQVVKWSEENFDFSNVPFVHEAYSKRKWAFVSDYARAWALYHYGGIYLDTDVEIKASLDEFLHNGAFSGFETVGLPFTALWGSERGHVWPKLVLEFYEKANFEEITNTGIVANILREKFGVDPLKDEIQVLENDITIYSSEYFCLDLPKQYATHHFNGSWKESDIGYKRELLDKYYLLKYIEGDKKVFHLAKLSQMGKLAITDILEYIPLKYLLKYTLLRLKNKVKQGFN